MYLGIMEDWRRCWPEEERDAGGVGVWTGAQSLTVFVVIELLVVDEGSCCALGKWAGLGLMGHRAGDLRRKSMKLSQLLQKR